VAILKINYNSYRMESIIYYCCSYIYLKLIPDMNDSCNIKLKCNTAAVTIRK